MRWLYFVTFCEDDSFVPVENISKAFTWGVGQCTLGKEKHKLCTVLWDRECNYGHYTCGKIEVKGNEWSCLQWLPLKCSFLLGWPTYVPHHSSVGNLLPTIPLSCGRLDLMDSIDVLRTWALWMGFRHFKWCVRIGLLRFHSFQRRMDIPLLICTSQCVILEAEDF